VIDIEERRMRFLRAERDLYRNALIRLYVNATSGKRKTMDCDEIASITARAYDEGNALSRRAKALTDG